MSLTVEEALKLPCLRDAKVIAGAKGLSRKIARISVSECKEFPLDLRIIGKSNMLFREQEFYITSGYAIKDEPGMLLDTVKLYNQYNSSGILITNRFFKEFDKSVIDYADEVNYPIISFRRETPYSDIIMELSQAIFLNEGNTLNESIVEELRDTRITPRKVKSLAYKLNPVFQPNNHAICIFFDDEKLKAVNVVQTLESSANICSMFYRNYILVFFTSRDRISRDTLEKNVKYVKSIVSGSLGECSIGVSSAHGDVSKIRDVIEEAIIACEASRLEENTVQNYEETGMYRFLLRLKDKGEMQRFYKETLKGLNEQNEAKKEEMLNTLRLFVKCDGDVKRMAEETFQHVNTVRYRLAKLKTMLGTENSELEFITTVNLLHKIKQIMENHMENNE